VPELVRTLGHVDASHAARWVGVMAATYASAQFVAAPILGGLSDRFGRRPVLVLSLLGVSFDYLLLAVAPSIGWLLVGRLLAGVTGANISTANAYIADVTPQAQRSQRFGLIGAAFGAGFIFGPALGGLLGSITLRLPFVVAAGLALCNATYGAFRLPESLPVESRRSFSFRRANPVGSLHALAADPVVKRMAVAWWCMWFGLGALQTSFVLSTALRFAWGPAENGWALATIGVSQALVQGFLVRPVIRFLGERRAVFAGFTLSAGAYLAFGLASAGWVIYAGVLLQALGSVASPAIRALLSARAAPERQGELQGGLASVQGLTAVISPIIAAALFATATRMAGPAGSGAPFVLAAVMYCVALAVAAGI
jgi:DHA1 family tetracycline resistance protein-like MFS transporter